MVLVPEWRGNGQTSRLSKIWTGGTWSHRVQALAGATVHKSVIYRFIYSSMHLIGR